MCTSSNKYTSFNFKINFKDASNAINTDNTECLTAAVNKEAANLPRCPHCGESYYMENFGITTAVYYPPIYKDGVNINPDRNTTSVNCTCMNCGKEFTFSR